MNYVNYDPRTIEALSQGVQNHRLIRASFYFWQNGKSLQKSEQGLLRSLLHQVFSQRRQLIPIVFEERYNAMCSSIEEMCLFAPSIPELKRAIFKMVGHKPSTYFFFSVDGLDEYDVEGFGMTEITAFFKTLAALPNVKCLLSSRPMLVFEDAFAENSKLRLHELTQSDITDYVNQRIGHHDRMKVLMKQENENAQNLVSEIVSASAGVFLWVRLVVNSLLEGLTNFDGITDLQHRLRELPADIEDLYRHMMNKIPSLYRRQASEMLQVIRAAPDLSPILLSFALEHDTELVFRIDIGAIESVELESRIKDIEGRIKSRCTGLVEVQGRKSCADPLHEYGVGRPNYWVVPLWTRKVSFYTEQLWSS